MAEAEDRTQAPSKLRHQQAREQGQVAHSAELTTAAALFGVALMLGPTGESLAGGLLALVRSPWTDGLPVSLGAGEAVAHLRSVALGMLGPLAMLTLALAGAGVAAHQAQVGLLWTPARLAPDVGRLWGVSAGQGLGARAGRGAWTIARSAAVLAAAVLAIRSRVDGLAALGGLDIPTLARAWSDAARGVVTTMALAMLTLGVVDYALQRRRFAGMLRLTPDEAREDRKATDGDPALRDRRRRLARAWRGDAPELLAGAALVVSGDGGLALILDGGPPPEAVTIRSAADGATGRAVLRSAAKAGTRVLADRSLAARLARRANPPGRPLPDGLMADLAAAWPAS